MGTRNLTVIIKDNKIKLSQYGQWDGYFECTGTKFVNFIRENLSGYRLQNFKERVDLLRSIDAGQMETLTMAYNEQKKNKEFLQPFNLMFPQLSRDTGVDILNLIMGLDKYEFNGEQGFPIRIMNSDWVEFIYIINLDTDEVYMLTSHEFTGEPIETCPLVKKLYGDCCWYKSKIKSLPSARTILKHYKQIGL